MERERERKRGGGSVHIDITLQITDLTLYQHVNWEISLHTNNDVEDR